MKYKSYPLAQFKALAEGQGQFEAIVAVFNNVDRSGERILPGAFTQSLANWRKAGDPIPVLFAHEWDNLDAHIGAVLEAKELFPGAPELPADLSTLGGLYVKAKLDMEEPAAKRIWQLMSQRRLKAFSFAYDVTESREVGDQGKAAPNHWLDLVTLDLLEVGPCLVGMNPDTELLTVKSGARHTAKEFEQIQQIHDLAIALGAKCAPSEDDGARGDSDEDDAKSGDQGQTAKSGVPRNPQTLAVQLAQELFNLEE